MTTLPTTKQDVPPAPPDGHAAPVAQELMRELVLLIEGLSTAEQFQALTAMDPMDVAQFLTDPMRVAQFERRRRELEANGELTRLDAAKRSRKVIGLADQIMSNEEAHPSTRLNAGQTILRAAGAEKPAADAARPTERHTITINIGDPSKNIVIDATPVRAAASLDTV